MSSNWLLLPRSGDPRRLGPDADGGPLGGPLGGSSAAAQFEINTAEDGAVDNAIFRLSTDDRSAAALMARATDEFEATLRLSDESDDDDAPPTPGLRHHRTPQPSPALRRLTSQPQASPSLRHSVPATPPSGRPHSQELRVSDPFAPEAAPLLADRIAARSTLLSSPYVYRDGSPAARKLAYRVVKARAPPPPPHAPPQPAMAVPERASLSRAVYRREEKRPAPAPPSQPPQPAANHSARAPQSAVGSVRREGKRQAPPPPTWEYEHAFWAAVEEEASRPLPSTGAVEARARRKTKTASTSRRDSRDSKRSTRSLSAEVLSGGGRHEELSLTFREKMVRFFGLGRRRSRLRPRASSFNLESVSNSDVRFGARRNGPVTLQTFSYAHTKAFGLSNGDQAPAPAAATAAAAAKAAPRNGPRRDSEEWQAPGQLVMGRYGEVTSSPCPTEDNFLRSEPLSNFRHAPDGLQY